MTKRIIRQKPTNGIERAATRAGIKPTPDARARKFIDDIASAGQTLSRPGLEALAGVIRENGDEELAQAFERCRPPSIILPDTDPAIQLAYLKDKIIAATDLVGEAIASVTDQDRRDTIDLAFLGANLDDIHLALWRIRWECYATGGKVATKSEEQTAEQVSS